MDELSNRRDPQRFRHPFADRLGRLDRAVDPVDRPICGSSRQSEPHHQPGDPPQRGYEVEVRADDSYAIFEEAAAAVRAAIGFQRRLETTQWPDRLRVRVRVGIHSGEISLSEGEYVGLSVNTAARVMAAGHGGQILTTTATHHPIGSEAPDGVMFRRLGAHRFAGFANPVELLQIDAEGLAEDFPRARATSS